jgi:hypothetical protein
VFASGSEEGLVAAIDRSRTGGQEERSAAERFRSDVLERYRWDRVVEETERVYDTIVGGKRRRPS